MYEPHIEPKPKRRPVYHTIVGLIAKNLTKELKLMVISDGGLIKIYNQTLDDEYLYHDIFLTNLGSYKVMLSHIESRTSDESNEEEYQKFINRMFDLYLLYYSDDYEKYHPNLPFILKKEPTFDNSLIEDTGIWDLKEYYRSVRKINSDLYLILDRNTKLTSYKSLLTELKYALRRYERYSGKEGEYDFYDPPNGFISYINSLYIGKTAYTRGYPGPKVNRIKQITWDYRSKDVTPGQTSSIREYFYDSYGLEIDPNQPLIRYELETYDGELREQYHVPELLVVNHNFRDLRMIISPWQRAQVWDYIQPNCKNQLREIYTLVNTVDEGLSREFPELYGKYIKFNTTPEMINDKIISIPQINILFKDKNMNLNPIYNKDFYKKYTNSLKYAEPIKNDVNLMLHLEDNVNPDDFILAIKKEFERRNGSNLIVVLEKIDFDDINLVDYDVIMTVSDDNDFYYKCKTIIQNKYGIVHQNIKPDNFDVKIIPPLVMQITLALGGNPWILDSDNEVNYVGIYSYRSRSLSEYLLYYNIFDNKGRYVKQSLPFELSHIDDFLNELVDEFDVTQNLVFISYFDKHRLLDALMSNLEQFGYENYIIFHVKEGNNLRFFNTWRPRKITRRRRRSNIPTYPFESYEQAPQGIIAKFSDLLYYIVTSRSVERSDETFRGCPNPITIEVFGTTKSIDIESEVIQLLRLCFMGCKSGHMTRLPAPLEYLRDYAGYVEKYNIPEKISFRNKLYYI